MSEAAPVQRNPARNRSTAYNDLALQRLDVLLHREILRLRARYQLSLDEFRGLYVSDEQVDALLKDVGGITEATDMTARAETLYRQQVRSRSAAWEGLRAAFTLSECELDIMFLALAPDLDIKYDTLYGYLNNDITRKYPTLDMALRLLDRYPESLIRAAVSPQNHLLEEDLIEPVHASGSLACSVLSVGFKIAPALSQHLLGLPAADPLLRGLVELEKEPVRKPLPVVLRKLIDYFHQHDRAPPCVLEGSAGVGRAALAAGVCHKLNKGLLRTRGDFLATDKQLLEQRLRALRRLARLRNCGIAISLPEEPDLALLLGFFGNVGLPLFFLAESGESLASLSRPNTVIRVSVPDPDVGQRRQLWQMHLAGQHADASDIDELAKQFVLNQGHIAAAADQIAFESAGQPVARNQLFRAARHQSVTDLGRLAQRQEPIHNWEHLVLPPMTLQRVRDVAAAIRHRNQVYADWGLKRRFGGAGNLVVLFSGSSGTGKTMTAGVIAGDIGLDLYRIDLSGVVSKYIGETEKNLDRIFLAAHRANAILFLDEADALMGKRSEVKDAHDRYANIEVAYLLQKLEDHEGVVILATNLSQNMDTAFTRRMHYTVDFPRPDHRHRERLWRGIFPAQTPTADDIDFAFLARQFKLTGGDIKTTALEAAFLAAKDRRQIDMEHLIKAMGRQMIKQGKAVSATDFKHYHHLVERPGPDP